MFVTNSDCHHGKHTHTHTLTYTSCQTAQPLGQTVGSVSPPSSAESSFPPLTTSLFFAYLDQLTGVCATTKQGALFHKTHVLYHPDTSGGCRTRFETQVSQWLDVSGRRMRQWT